LLENLVPFLNEFEIFSSLFFQFDEFGGFEDQRTLRKLGKMR